MLNLEEGQYVVLVLEPGGKETVFTTAYGADQVTKAIAFAKREHPLPASTRFAKGSRAAIARNEPWTREPGEESA